MSTVELIEEVCLRLLSGAGTLDRSEMRVAGYIDDETKIDVCDGIK